MMYFDAALVADLLFLLLCLVALVVLACGLMYFMCDLIESARADYREDYRDRRNR